MHLEQIHHFYCWFVKVARVTGLEPATSGVTGRHSNQLSYTRVSKSLSNRRMNYGFVSAKSSRFKQSRAKSFPAQSL